MTKAILRLSICYILFFGLTVGPLSAQTKAIRPYVPTTWSDGYQTYRPYPGYPGYWIGNTDNRVYAEITGFYQFNQRPLNAFRRALNPCAPIVGSWSYYRYY